MFDLTGATVMGVESLQAPGRAISSGSTGPDQPGREHRPRLGEDRLELTAADFSLSPGRGGGRKHRSRDGVEAVFANASSFDTALLIDGSAAPVTVNFIAGR